MVAKRDEPCEKCGWKMPGFHICIIDLRTKDGIRAATRAEYTPPKKRKSRARPGANRSDTVKAIRAAEPGRAERDAEIIRLYDEAELSMTGVSRHMNLDFRTVQRVLHLAANDDKIVLRVNRGGRPRHDAVQA